MPTLGLLLGHLPQARTTRLLAGLLKDSTPTGSTLVELPYFDLPLHSPSHDAPTPRAALEWKVRLAQLDGLVVITPTHERSLPGALKNALDWAAAAPSGLEGMPVAIAGAALPRAGRFVTLQHLRSVLVDAGATVMGQPERTLTVDVTSFGTSGLCVNHDLEGGATDLLSAAAGFASFAARPRPEVPVLGDPDDLETDTIDPIEAVRQAQAAGPGPHSPETGVPRVWVASLATVDPLVDSADPLFAALPSETVTGS